MIDKISVDERFGAATHTVELSNIKARGDVATKVGFTYEKCHGQAYSPLIDTVKRLDRDDLKGIKGKTAVQSEHDEDAPIIKAICTVISTGMVNKAKIVQEANALSGQSTARVRKVLNKRTGAILSSGSGYGNTGHLGAESLGYPG